MSAAVVAGLSPVRTVLPNGAVVLVQETTTIPAVALSATFRAGSVYEPASMPGLASLTGRVLDRGTEQRTAERIAEELDDRGVSIRVTAARHTLTLSCSCLAEDVASTVAILADIVRSPTFPEDEVQKRRAQTAAQRLVAHKAFHPLNAKRELPQCQRPFRRQPARP